MSQASGNIKRLCWTAKPVVVCAGLYFVKEQKEKMPIDNEILERLQANDRSLTELNLRGQALTASDMQELVKALQGNTSLKSLNVSRNQIKYEGAKALAQNQTLTSLDVSHNEIVDVGAKALAQNQTLTSLDVSINWIGDEGAKALAQNQTLISLNISGNQIWDGGANALAQNQTLTWLGVHANRIGDEAYQRIRLMLQTNQRHVIERRNQFILHWFKWTEAQLLPLELVAHIIGYVDSATFLALVNLRHFAHMGKSENQAYQCALFILHNASAVKEQFALTGPGEPFILERKPKGREQLSTHHFGLFKAPVTNLLSDATASLKEKSQAKCMLM